MYTKIAIGGTKGKTTTMSLIEHGILELKPELNILSSSSTEGQFINREYIKRPNRKEYLLATDSVNAANINHDIFLSEATSYLIDIFFYRKHKPDYAIFTGIEMNEHTETHKTFNDYLNAKKKLYDYMTKKGCAIVNSDSPYANEVIKDCKAEVLRYGLNSQADFQIRIVSQSTIGTVFKIKHQSSEYEISTQLLGSFNLSNICAAFVVLFKMGFKTDKIIDALSTFGGVPGRFERYKLDNSRIAIIDYAHTEESLRNMIGLLRELYKKKKIITVFGCGGERGNVKRPLMGGIASKLSDKVYITSDNPRSEDKREIINDIVKGIHKSNYKVFINRQTAIERAVTENKNSVILIAGKGSENKTETSETMGSIVCKHCGKTNRYNHWKPKPKKIKITDFELLQKVVKKYNFMELPTKDGIRSYTKSNGHISGTNKDLLEFKLKVASNCYIRKCKDDEDSELVSKPSNKVYAIIDPQTTSIIRKLKGQNSVIKVFKESKYYDKENIPILKNNIKQLIDDNVLIIVK